MASYLQGHIASIHENRKPFTCEICSFSFARKPNLKKHIESVHAGKKPFKCDISDANFTQKPNLKQHIESDNEGNKPNILNQFMQERNHSYVTFVMIILLKNKT